MSTYAATHRSGLKDTDPNAEFQRLSDSNLRVEAHAACDKAQLSFTRASMLASITCGEEVRSKFHSVETQMAKMLDATMKKDPGEPFGMLPDLVRQIQDLVKVVRAELGIDPAT